MCRVEGEGLRLLQDDFAKVTTWCCIEHFATALEATQRQMDGFFSQLPYKCHLEEVASVRD